MRNLLRVHQYLLEVTALLHHPGLNLEVGQNPEADQNLEVDRNPEACRSLEVVHLLVARWNPRKWEPPRV